MTDRSSALPWRLVALVSVLAAGGAVAGCGDGGGSTTGAGGRPSGEALYLTACASCHGDSGEGRPGLGDPIAPDLTPVQARSVIRNGMGAMPGFPDLPDDQVEAIVDYITGDLHAG